MDHTIFMPHGVCLMWQPKLIWLHVITDGLVALSYYSIPAALFLLASREKQRLALKPILILFGLFIAFCGGGHVLDIISIWKPIYWAKGWWNAGTALTSVVTAIILIPQVTGYLRLPDDAARLRRQANEWEEKHGLLRAVLDSVDEGVLLTGQDGRVRTFNAAATGMLPSDAAGRPQISWKGHAETDRSVEYRGDRRVIERFTTSVPGYGRLYVLRDVSERARAEAQRQRLARIIDEMKQGFYVTLDSGEIIATNLSFDRMMGYARGELVGKNIAAVRMGAAEDLQQFSAAILEAVERDGYWEGEIRSRRKDGSEFPANVRVNLHREEGRTLLSSILVDITDQKQLEAERERLQRSLLQSAKLESLGVLGGGVAHDFNNLLTGIMGHTSLVLDALPANHALREHMELALEATERAAELTQQLLAYSGKGRFLIEPVDFSRVCSENAKLLRRLVKPGVDLKFKLAEGLPAVEADRAQMQQLLFNLVINGGEAIEDGSGTVEVTTSREELAGTPAGADFNAENMRPGTYVVLEVCDTGSGMNPAIRQQIFDPFFTTKFTGRGLGLAAVQGIVRSHHGAIQVRSEPGRGSTFRILLPASQRPAAVPQPPREQDLQGAGTVLVVDDEEVVRRTAQTALEKYGYKVVVAENGEKGLETFRQSPERFALVLLDMTMPVMSGEETLRRMKMVRPSVRVILSSGYGDEEAVRRFSSIGIAGFLQKPYTSARLGEKVKSVLA